MKTALTLTLLLLATASLASPAPAAEDPPETVTLIVEAPPKLLSSHQSFSWTLTLDWADAVALNTTGTPTALDLLTHAVDQEGSTKTLIWSDMNGDGIAESAFVDEINGVASDFSLILVGYFWALYENDASATSGINHIALEPADVIRLTYTGWPADA